MMALHLHTCLKVKELKYFLDGAINGGTEILLLVEDHELQLLEDPKNYGSLKNTDNIKDSILRKQMESLQMIMLSMTKTLYLLKSSVISALASLALKPSVSDLHAFEQLLVDQPNIPKEVQSIYDVIFAEEIC
ncbi:hypothetical protein L1987_42725 [Smallanthus sonchifolius]|uniref:Uncharacterized protein n=1 Tax=Smallanthus sonchifolius TaxID=185202 RepID=A0ACB9GJ59_9ASTR|nr:hypothetical protein L1987_42725 [Smallanthus sonchifolius]